MKQPDVAFAHAPWDTIMLGFPESIHMFLSSSLPIISDDHGQAPGRSLHPFRAETIISRIELTTQVPIMSDTPLRPNDSNPTGSVHPRGDSAALNQFRDESSKSQPETASSNSSLELNQTVPQDDARRSVAEMEAFLGVVLEAPADESLPRSIGDYRLLALLGQGGMGAVYRAEDIRLKRYVALKVMRPEIAANPASKDRFLREARAMAALRHDNIVGIYQVGEEDGVPFLAMELLEGMSLQDCLDSGLPLDWNDVLRIGRDIARGLAAAHSKGMIHRDIKPGNIWLETVDPSADDAPNCRFRVHILDFGLARSISDKAHLTSSGAILGTPNYMAPEQVRGDALDGRCDLFSLGVLLYKLCSGQLPFQGKDILAALSALALSAPEPICSLNPEVPVRLEQLIDRLLAKNAEDRPAYAQLVATELTAIIHELGLGASMDVPLATPVEGAGPVEGVADLSSEIDHEYADAGRTTEHSAPGPAAKPVRRRKPIWIGIACLGLLLAALAVAFSLRERKVTQQNLPDRNQVSDARNDKAPIDSIEDVKKKKAPTEDVKKKAPVESQEDARRKAEAARQQIEVVKREAKAALQQAEREAAMELNRFVDQSLKVASGIKIHWRNEPIPEVLLNYPREQPPPLGPAIVAENRAVQFVMKLGGTVLRNETLPNKPVVEVRLTGSKVTDAGLKELTPFKNLTSLHLGLTAITDAGVKELTPLENLTRLFLGSTELTDAALKELPSLKNLSSLVLGNTRVTDAGLRELVELKSLSSLGLAHTVVTDNGIRELARLTNLTALDLQGTKVTNAGVNEMAALRGLVSLDLRYTEVTDDGVKELRQTLPKCTILIASTAIPVPPKVIVSPKKEEAKVDPVLDRLLGPVAAKYHVNGYKGRLLGSARSEIEKQTPLTASADNPACFRSKAAGHDEEFLFDSDEKLVMYVKSYNGGSKDHLEEMLKVFGQTERSSIRNWTDDFNAPVRKNATTAVAHKTATAFYHFPKVFVKLCFISSPEITVGGEVTWTDRTIVAVLSKAWALKVLSADLENKRANLKWLREVVVATGPGKIDPGKWPKLDRGTLRKKATLGETHFVDSEYEHEIGEKAPAFLRAFKFSDLRSKGEVLEIKFIFDLYSKNATPQLYHSARAIDLITKKRDPSGERFGNNAFTLTNFSTEFRTELNALIAAEYFPPSSGGTALMKPEFGIAHYEWRTEEDWKVTTDGNSIKIDIRESKKKQP